jgi:dolichol-phosphate mannosyltransferase
VTATIPSKRLPILNRWLRFNLVGLLGIFVQLSILATLTRLELPYLYATVLAVEAAVLHNWSWHERFTWSDRSSSAPAQRVSRLLKFNFSNGAVSLCGNLLFMHLLVGTLRLPVLLANTIAVIACALINFLLGDRFVFPAQPQRTRSCL